jgi:protein toll
LQPQDIQFLSSDVTVNLTYNSISVIDLQYLEPFAKAQNSQSLPNRRILLDQNPLMCDCEVYYLLRYLEDRLEPEARSMFEIIPDNLSCAGPPDFRGIVVKQLSSLKLYCSLPQLWDCPQPCACYERPSDSALIVDCSSLNLLQPPANLPDPVKIDEKVLSPQTIKLNQTELRLRRNSIAMLPPTTAPGYDRVTMLYLSHNNISTLEAEQVPPNLQVSKYISSGFGGLGVACWPLVPEFAGSDFSGYLRYLLYNPVP